MSAQSKHPKSQAASLVEAGRTVGIIGAGVMGRTLIKGLLDSGTLTAGQIWATAKSQATCERATAELQVSVEVNYHARVPAAGLILICVKPSQAAKVLAELRQAGPAPDALMISIMAGTTSAQLESMLATDNPWGARDAEYAMHCR